MAKSKFDGTALMSSGRFRVLKLDLAGDPDARLAALAYANIVEAEKPDAAERIRACVRRCQKAAGQP